MKYETIAHQIKEASESVETIFAREVVARNTHAIIGRIEDEANPVSRLKEILGSRDMQALIDDGMITIGMIKPRLDQHMDLNKVKVGFNRDHELAEYAIESIKKPLDVLATISLKMTPEMVDEFYDGAPKENMQAAKDPGDERTVWDNFKELMVSGPVTFLIIGSPDGNAIDLWRETIGRSWDVTKAIPGVLRSLMKSNRNNGFHGSDKIQAVKKELGFVISHMMDR